MARQKTKICLSCDQLFRGRSDARTCSERCRKRLYRAKLALSKEAQSLTDSAETALHSTADTLKSIESTIASELIPKIATEGGFVEAPTLAKPVTASPLNSSPAPLASPPQPSTPAPIAPQPAPPLATPIASAPPPLTPTPSASPSPPPTAAPVSPPPAPAASSAPTPPSISSLASPIPRSAVSSTPLTPPPPPLVSSVASSPPPVTRLSTSTPTQPVSLSTAALPTPVASQPRPVAGPSLSSPIRPTPLPKILSLSAEVHPPHVPPGAGSLIAPKDQLQSQGAGGQPRANNAAPNSSWLGGSPSTGALSANPYPAAASPTTSPSLVGSYNLPSLTSVPPPKTAWTSRFSHRPYAVALGFAAVIVLVSGIFGLSRALHSGPSPSSSSSSSSQLASQADQALNADSTSTTITLNLDTVLATGKKLTLGQIVADPSSGVLQLTGDLQASGTLAASGGTTSLNNDGLVINKVTVCTVAGCIPNPRITPVTGSSGTAPPVPGLTSLPPTTTLQGNSFNGPSQLVQLTTAGALPALNAAALIAVNAASLQGNSSSFYTNASNLSTGTLNDARLTTNVTLQGNGFNGAFQLVQLNGSSQLPAISGINLTNLNANSVASGTLADARLSTNVALLAGTGPQIFTGNNKFAGTFLAQNASDSTTAFQIQNAAGTSNLLVANTTSTRIAIGQATAAYTLDVAGDINSTTGVRVGGALLCNAGGCTAAGGSNSYIQNSTALQTAANFNIQSAAAASVTGTMRAITSQSADLLQLKDQAAVNILTISPTGNVLIQPSTNSTTAFQVFNKDATSHLIGGDTLNARVAIAKPTPPDYTLDVGGDINSTTGLRVGGNLVCSSTCTPGGGSGNYVQNGTALQTANYAIQSDLNSHVVALIRGASGQSADMLRLVAGDASVNLLTVGGTGATKFQNSVDSTTAFQIQNSAGSNLVQVDTTNANVTLNGINTGTLQSWSTNVNAITAGREYHTSVVANGYIYVIGGLDNSGFVQSTVYYAKLNADGSTGSWSTNANAIPAVRQKHTSVVANGYIYVIGGSDGTNPQSTVYYAKLNADGSTGSWSTNANAIPAVRERHTSVVANGYVYVLGGNSGAGRQSTVYYAKLNADGSTGAWSTNANALTAVREYHSSIVANGYIYVIGGGDNTNSALSTVYYAKLNADGSTGSWSTNANALPAARVVHSSIVANGYIYVIGGTDNSSVTQSTVYYAQLNTDGSTGSWSTNSNALPAVRRFHNSVIANGYVYVSGGGDSTSTVQSTVYYASVSRLKVGGSLDLVGLPGQTLSDPGSAGGLGSTGGSITAGDITAVGALQIQGQGSFSQGLSANGNLTIGGSAIFNSLTTASPTSQVAIGTGGVANIGLTIQSVAAQTANIFQIQTSGGSNAIWADSNANFFGNTIVAGGSATGASTTLQVKPTATNRIGEVIQGLASQISDLQQWQNSAGTILASIGATGAAFFQNSTNSAAAFRIQNAAGTNLFVTDTGNGQLAVGPSGVPANGALTIGTNTTAATGGLYFGTDTNLYRGAATQLQTDGQLNVGKGVIVGNADATSKLYFGASQDTNLYRGAASQLKTDSAVLVQPTTNSTAAFQIQNSAGTSNLLVADTTNTRIGIGTASPDNILTVGSVLFGALYNKQISLGVASNTSGLVIGEGSANYASFNWSNTAGQAYLTANRAGNGAVNALTIYNVNSTTGRVGINTGTVTPTNGVLTIGTNTTADTGGIYFGTDTNLYRSFTKTLTTDAALESRLGNTTLLATGGTSYASVLGKAQNVTVDVNQNNLTLGSFGVGTLTVNTGITLSDLYGVSSSLSGTYPGSGTITTAIAGAFNAGSIGTNRVSLLAGDISGGTTNINLMVGNEGGIPASGTYGIYQSTANSNVFAGNTRIGSTTSPTATLDVAGTALFKNGSNSTTAFQVQNAAGTSLFTVDTTNSTITVGPASATPVVLVLGNKNTSGDPTCTNGGIYYNSNTSQFRGCDNGAWNNLAGTDTGTTLPTTNLYDGRQFRLRAGSSPYEFVDLTYDATYAKWISAAFPMVNNILQSSTTSATYVALTGSTQAETAVSNHKSLYDAGLRLQIYHEAYFDRSGVGITSFGSVKLLEYTSGDSNAGTVIASGQAEISSGSSSVRVSSGWVGITYSPAPTKDFVIAIIEQKQSGGGTAYYGTNGGGSVRGRWVSQ